MIIRKQVNHLPLQAEHPVWSREGVVASGAARSTGASTPELHLGECVGQCAASASLDPKI